MPYLELKNLQPDPPLSGRPRLVVIVGATAVGKTELSIQLASMLAGEIVSADSRLFYRGMDIGTAKPTPAERMEVPHHLIDVANPDEVWSVAQFQQNAHRVIEQILQRDRLPFLVGGTGQYIQAITQGWQIPHVTPNPYLRSALEQWAIEVTPTGLHERLSCLDPEAAKAIDARNVRRTIRALEVIISTGEHFSTQRKRILSPYNILTLGLTRSRQELYTRVDQRLALMIKNGFIEEVAQLLRAGYTTKLPSMSAIGYLEIAMYLQGEISQEEAIRLIKRRTRKFIRRQANWFKLNDPNIHWFQVGEDTLDDLYQEIIKWQSIPD